MLDQVITNYINKTKKEWVRREITPKTKEDKLNRLKEKADSLFTTQWLEEIIKNISSSKDIDRLKYTTHSPKFSHPDVKLDAINFNSKSRANGLVSTGNVVSTNLDMYSNSGAAYLKKDFIYAYEFLVSKLPDRKMVIEHLHQSTQDVIKIFSQLNIESSFDEVRSNLIQLAYTVQPSSTNEKVKQVYFPVNRDYHLLSLLSASPLMSELRSRIQAINFSNENKDTRKALRDITPIKSELNEIFNLTKIGFGGANKQNISVLNNKDGGYFYLLSSMPPIFEKRKTQPPKHNFFENCLWPNLFKSDFVKFHKVLSWRKNDIDVRDMRDDIVLNSMAKLQRLVGNVRDIGEGWSDSETYQDLPRWQKVWLDEQYISDRNDKNLNDGYLVKAQSHFANWFIYNYRQSTKNNKLLGDDDVDQIKKILKEEQELLQ